MRFACFSEHVQLQSITSRIFIIDRKEGNEMVDLLDIIEIGDEERYCACAASCAQSEKDQHAVNVAVRNV